MSFEQTCTALFMAVVVLGLVIASVLASSVIVGMIAFAYLLII